MAESVGLPKQVNLLVSKFDEITEKQNQLEASTIRAMPQNDGRQFCNPDWQKEMEELRYTISAVSLQIQELTKSIISNTGTTKIEEQEQYSRRNCLIIHGLDDISETADCLQFENCVVDKINHFQLGTITNNDIDTAHPLPDKTGSKPAVIVKFTRRNVKIAIYRKKTLLKNFQGIGITESLTKTRLAPMKAAKEKYGLKQVGSVDGNIFAYINNKRKYIRSVSDLGKS